MDEYASKRLILVCCRVSRLPTVIVTAEMTARIAVQEEAKSGNATKNKRINTAKPAAFEAVDKNPETGVGAPSYTSGAQKWNGTMETLKPIPTRMRARMPKPVVAESAPALNIPA